MKKNEFLQQLASEALIAMPAWQFLLSRPRDYAVFLGRKLPNVLLALRFTSRGDRDLFDQAVGWAPDETALMSELDRRETPPVRTTEGQLRRVLMVERPRDFRHELLFRPVSNLARPVGGYRLENGDYTSLKAQMLSEVVVYGLPYLALFLRFRYGYQATAEQLSGGAVEA